MIIVTPSFSKTSVFKMFSVYRKTKIGPLKRVFVKLRFRDGLVWMVGITLEIKLHL